MIRGIISSFGWAIAGLKTVWREERNFRIEMMFTVLVIGLSLYFKFSFEEMVACLVAVVLVLCAEIVNTAIEDMCNKIEPNHDPLIGKIKDIMAGFVLITALGTLMIVGLTFAHHFM